MGLFDDIGSWVDTTANRVATGVTTSFQNPSMLLGDVVNSALIPLSLTADAVGGIVGGDTGASITRVTHEVNVATEQDPASSAYIIAGSAVTVAGAVTGGAISSGGVALLAKGVGGITVDVINAENAYQNGAASSAPAGVATPAQPWGPQGSSLWAPTLPNVPPGTQLQKSVWAAFVRG